MKKVFKNKTKNLKLTTLGFTLIELLAVIVILAIIALIATPLTINVINSAKEKSFINSVYGLIDGVRLLSAEQLFDEQTSDVIVNFTDGVADNTNFKVSGDMPKSGTIHLNSEGKVELKVWSEELGKCAEKSVNESQVSFTEISEEDCHVNVILSYQTFTEVMTNNSQVMNNDPDGNLRYVGANPDNYISFNGELWRIIGVFDGQAKIIKNGYYNDGNGIAYDKGAAAGGTHGTYGHNDWSKATLQVELNGAYLSNIQSNNPTSYGYIDLEHVWNIGVHPSDNSFEVNTRSDFYNIERSDNTTGEVGSGAMWTGAIGLMYPSDYGYSTSESASMCDNRMNSWGSYSTCYSNSWLYDSNHSQWTITARSYFTDTAFKVFNSGKVDNGYIDGSSMAKPVLYLKHNIVIVDGYGTYEQPYLLELL